MSDLIVNLNVNKISKNNTGMGTSYGRYASPTNISSQSNLRTDVYAQQYNLLCSVKKRNLSVSRFEMESKGLRLTDQHEKKTIGNTVLQATSLQAITAWTELCWRVKRAYRIAAKEMTELPLADELGVDAKRLAETLWRDDWQQLLLKLQVLLREMAVEQREKLRKAAAAQGPNHPEKYVRALLHGHQAFCAAGEALAPCLPEQVDKLFARRFAPADFRLLNSRMFESCVYSDPVVQDSMPAAIGRAAGADRQLVHSYLALDEQMTDVASRWLDIKKLILKLGKGRAQLLDNWRASRELRELAGDSQWRIRSKPPPASALPDFDVQLLSLADELSTDRSCACTTEDQLPDTPPLSPNRSDLLKLVGKATHLVASSPAQNETQQASFDKPLAFAPAPSKQMSASKTTSTSTKANKENHIPKTVNTCTHVPFKAANCDHKEKCLIFKKKTEEKKPAEKCSHEKGHCDKKKTYQCECLHNESSDSSVRQSTKYNKLRERLRTRLKEKQKGPQTNEATSTESTDNRDITQLLNFIEGNGSTADPVKAQKNAARKLRRQERKLEAQRQKQEAERLQLEQERQRLEQERQRLEQEAAAKVTQVKMQSVKEKREQKERARQQMTAAVTDTDPAVRVHKSGPMVTIKRVMQGSNKEPTVTITLKGSTPDKDKLLFTLINGQSEDGKDETNTKSPQIDTSKLSKKQRKKLKKEQAKNLAMHASAKISKKETNLNLSSSHKTKPTVNNNNVSSSSSTSNCRKATATNSTLAVAAKQKAIVTEVEPAKEKAVKLSINAKPDVLNLQMLRLPPGITITKVEGPSAERKLQLNPKTTLSKAQQSSQNLTDNRAGIIVVDTVKLKQDLPLPTTLTETSLTQKYKRNKKKKKKNAETKEKTSDESQNVPAVTGNNTNIFTLKNPMFYQVQDGNSDAAKQLASNQQASIIKNANGMVTIRSPRLGSCNGDAAAAGFMSLKNMAGDNGSPKQQLGELKPVMQTQGALAATASKEKPFDAQQILSGLPGIEITKINKGAPRVRSDRGAFQPADVSIIPTSMSANGDVYKLFYDNADWSLESVFAPKDLKEDEILDAEELELEAFKRFCQQSVPPERKEKVAYLNVKDIILNKKKASEKC